MKPLHPRPRFVKRNAPPPLPGEGETPEVYKLLELFIEGVAKMHIVARNPEDRRFIELVTRAKAALYDWKTK